MAELESSLISERVTAGMQAAEACGKHLGRPPTAPHVVRAIVEVATSTGLGIRQIQAKIVGSASRTIVDEITKGARFTVPFLVTTFYTYFQSTWMRNPCGAADVYGRRRSGPTS